MSRRRLLWMFIAFVLAFLILVTLVFVLSSLSNVRAQGMKSPDRVAVMPGMVGTGSALMVSFWGAEPDSIVTVTVEDADSWKCYGGGCGIERLIMPTYLVRTDGRGHGYFAVGVPCGYPPGLLRLDVGGTDVSVVVKEGRWCRSRTDWISGMR